MSFKKGLLGLLASVVLYAGMPRIVESYHPPRRTLKGYVEMKTRTDNPQKVWEFFSKKGITYKKDQEGLFQRYDGTLRVVSKEFMQDPIDTFLIGEGDCDCFAALAKDWLVAAGYEAKIVGFFSRGSKEGHVVCAVREHGGWSYLGNDDYIKGYSSIEQLVEKNEPHWGVYYELRLNEESGTGCNAFNVVYKDDGARRGHIKFIESLK